LDAPARYRSFLRYSVYSVAVLDRLEIDGTGRAAAFRRWEIVSVPSEGEPGDLLGRKPTKYDDQVDALSLVGQLLNKISAAPRRPTPPKPIQRIGVGRRFRITRRRSHLG
jgi:hypothetical protein